MKLHELKPAEGSRKVRNLLQKVLVKYVTVLVVVLHQVTVKHLVVVKKVKKLVAVVEYVLVLKVDKLHCSVVFQNVDSLTSTLKNMQLLTLTN